MGILFGCFFLVGLVFYTPILSPHSPSLLSLESYELSQLGPDKTPTNQDSSSYSHTADEAPSSPFDVLSLEQVREIVTPTRGFFARDYSLNLGWNNVSVCSNLIQAELMISK